MLKQKYKISNLVLAGLGLVFLISFSSNGNAFSAKNTAVQDAVVSYNTTSTIYPGMIVGLKQGSSDNVVPLSIANVSEMLGVVVEPSQAAIALTPTKSTSQQVYVANSGDYNVLVSDQDGSIKTGDPISISSLAGIGMEANQNEGEIIGKALAPFNSKSSTIGTAKLSSSLSTSTLRIGSIPVSINIAHNPLLSGQASYVPGPISRVADTISNKPVSGFKIYASLLILIIAFCLSAVLFYSGVKSSIISIGRNPLSKKSIIRGLIQTVVIGILVFAAGVSGVYLILKL